MPEYSFEYEETQVFQVNFYVDNNGEAIGLLESIQNGNITPHEIDNATWTDKVATFVVDPNSLYRTDGEDI